MAKKKAKPKAKKKPKKKAIKPYQFERVAIPENKKPEKFTCIQRRADMIRWIEEEGHPEAITQRTLAKHYNVSQPQICQDMVPIKEYFREKIGKDADVTSSVFYESAIKRLMKQGRIIEASKLIRDWNEWLFNTGRQEKAPEKIEAKVGIIEIQWKDGEKKDNDRLPSASGAKKVPSEQG